MKPPIRTALWCPPLGLLVSTAEDGGGSFDVLRRTPGRGFSLDKNVSHLTQRDASAAIPAVSSAAAAGGRTLTIGVATISPLVALIAGILILVMPRLLNFIVAVCLILIGAIGLFGH